MKLKILIVSTVISVAFSSFATLPGETDFSAICCQGSAMPYPAPDSTAEWPDSLVPVMINHVGRHGARFPTSEATLRRLEKSLAEAPALSPNGHTALELTRRIIALSEGRWGQLDSLGIAEQQGIARRMFEAFPQLFIGHEVDAISSYVPRCVASMDAFTGELARLGGEKVSISADSGSDYDALLRPFEVDEDYLEFRREKPYSDELSDFTHAELPIEVAYRLTGQDISFEQAESITSDLYAAVSIVGAMGIVFDPLQLFSLEEYNRMWQVKNLGQYLERTATTVSDIPAEIAADLVIDLIETTDGFIAGSDSTAVYLRFGHAETIMPLASLLRLPGCYYLTHYFDTVGQHWQNWHVVPMASNIRMILFRSHDSGRYYLRTDLNEVPVTLLPGCPDLYVEWPRARRWLANRANQPELAD